MGAMNVLHARLSHLMEACPTSRGASRLEPALGLYSGFIVTLSALGTVAYGAVPYGHL